MTGAGSGTLIAGHEASFAGDLTDSDGDGTPELFALGRDPSLTELSLDNQLERMREGDAVEAVESIKTNFEGAVDVEAVVNADVHGDVEKVVFNDGGTAFQSGLASSARIFTGVQYPSGQADRELLGCVPLEYSIDYEQGGTVSFTLTMAYADERPDPSTDLSTATRASAGTSVAFHGFDLQIDGTTVEDLQSCSLSISDISRLQYGGDPTANRAVIADPKTELELEAIFTSPSRLDLARGSADSAPPDQLDSVSGSVALSADGTPVSTYDLPRVKPAQYNWNNVVGTEDTTDSTTFHVNGGVTVA